MPGTVMFMIVAIVAISILGWVVTEIWGKKSRNAGVSPEADERVRELTRENEQLTQQLTAVHDRLETLERIVTDKPSRLEAEIDALKTLSDQREKQEQN